MKKDRYNMFLGPELLWPVRSVLLLCSFLIVLDIYHMLVDGYYYNRDRLITLEEEPDIFHIRVFTRSMAAFFIILIAFLRIKPINKQSDSDTQ